jgi:HPt (histidine-containing phosphotransfer) domain-containing protein
MSCHVVGWPHNSASSAALLSWNPEAWPRPSVFVVPNPQAVSSPARSPALTLDVEALDRLRELDPQGASRLLQRVVAAYVGSADRLLSQLDQAERAGDAAGIRMVAHTLKSSSASVGASQLAQVCAEVEALVRDHGVVPEVATGLQHLRRHLSEALVALSVFADHPSDRAADGRRGSRA